MYFWQKHTEEEKQEDQNYGGYIVLRTGNQQVSTYGGRMQKTDLHGLSS